jgi:PBSX family phage terminase large subunit
LFLFGGAGSGKSVYATTAKVVLSWFLAPTKERILIVRKVAKTLKQSCWMPIEHTIKEIGIWGDMKVNLTDKVIEDTETGNAIIMVGMDDPDKIKSIYNITKIFIEEADALTEEEFLQLDLRLRGQCDSYFQIVCAFNPVSKFHWLVKYVEPQFLPQMPEHIIDLTYLVPGKVWRFATNSASGKLYTTTLNTTYKDNSKIDAAYISRLQSLASVSEDFYQVYERGRWGTAGAGDLYCPNFKEAVHVSQVIHEPQMPLHYTCDFNVKPHMTGLVIQMRYDNGKYIVNVIDEYELQYPDNHAQALGTNFIYKYEQFVKFGVFLYGDASGNNRLGTKDTKSLFEDVLKGFDKYALAIEKRIPTHNPRYDKIAPNSLGRRAFLNAVFSGNLPVVVNIHPRCKELVKDLIHCTQDANGRLAKPKNSQGYEERGHALQALEYFICHPQTLGELAKI